MPDNLYIGATKNYWVDSIAGSGSTYTWKIDGVIQQSGSVVLFSTTWNVTGTYLLEVQETSLDGCQGAMESGFVYVTEEAVLDMICPEIEVLCAVETVPAYANLNSFLAAGGTISNNCSLDSSSFMISFEEYAGIGYPDSYNIIREYTISDLCGNTNKCTQTITIPEVLTGSTTSQTNVSIFGGNDGSVTVAGSGGTESYQDRLDSGVYQYKLGSGEYQYSGIFNSLIAGDYIVTVQDVNLCIVDVSITITQILSPLTGVVLSVENVLCSGDHTGSVTVAGLGGNEVYEYKIDEGSYQSSGTFSSLPAGSYTVTVKDEMSATFQVPVVILAMNTLPVADFTSSFSAMTYTFIDLSTNATSYLWDFGDGQTSTSVNPTNAYAATGTYTVTLLVSNSCGADTKPDEIRIALPDLEFYDGFSPNNDGINDDWNIPVLSYFPINSVIIINRWGSEVWKGVNYNNTSNIWSGKNMNGSDLPDGTYYFIINYSNVEKRGWVFIKR
jgi:gliding motility-associated-like protein